jgi:endonuclease/exonuclease/phosphatase family metal-dependent hydrolase
MTDKLHAGSPDAWGIALCTTGTLSGRQDMYYRDVVYPPSDAILSILKTRGVVKNGFKNGILCARATVQGDDFFVAVTHFTWGPEGEVATPEQHTSMDALLTYTENLEPHILCGDFNLPRDYNPLYERLAHAYTDNIPKTYTSSLDKNLHRLGDDSTKQHLFSSFMVDYILSRPPYLVSNVRLVFGVSDHAAVVGQVTKNTPGDVM